LGAKFKKRRRHCLTRGTFKATAVCHQGGVKA
jgi:hypothetical protein